MVPMKFLVTIHLDVEDEKENTRPLKEKVRAPALSSDWFGSPTRVLKPFSGPSLLCTYESALQSQAST